MRAREVPGTAPLHPASLRCPPPPPALASRPRRSSQSLSPGLGWGGGERHREEGYSTSKHTGWAHRTDTAVLAGRFGKGWLLREPLPSAAGGPGAWHNPSWLTFQNHPPPAPQQIWECRGSPSPAPRRDSATSLPRRPPPHWAPLPPYAWALRPAPCCHSAPCCRAGVLL